MNKYIESVNESVRPKSELACSNCPYSTWHSSKVIINMETVDALDCYCQKLFTYTFDSQNSAFATNGELLSGRYIVKCQDRDLAINELLK